MIRAAEQVGVQIPRFCDHPLLAPVGACRQCLVDVPDAGNGRGFPKPQASCTLPVAEGMVVNTQATSAVADKAQQGIMEFLLINHPLDCPVCDKGGECPLQNQAMSNGRGETRFAEGGVKRTFPKPINISAQVLLDRERCVLCARCTRFSEQIAGDPFIALVERGALQQVGIYEREPFESYFSGNTIQICPVGALTSAAYRFRSRPFDLVSTPGVAEHDACGCGDPRRPPSRQGDAPPRRQRPRGQRGVDHRQGPLRVPLRPGRGPAHLPAGPRACRTGTASCGPRRGPRPSPSPPAACAPPAPARVLTGGRLTAEDAYAYAKFARVALGTNDIDFRARPHSAEEAGFLAVARRAVAASVTYADLEAAPAVRAGRLEPEDEAAHDLPAAAQGRASTGTPGRRPSRPFTSRGLRQDARPADPDRARRRGRGPRVARRRRARRRQRRGDPRRRAPGRHARRPDRRRRPGRTHRRPARLGPAPRR